MMNRAGILLTFGIIGFLCFLALLSGGDAVLLQSLHETTRYAFGVRSRVPAIVQGYQLALIIGALLTTGAGLSMLLLAREQTATRPGRLQGVCIAVLVYAGCMFAGSILFYDTLYVHNTLIFYAYVVPFLVGSTAFVFAFTPRIIRINMLILLSMLVLLEVVFGTLDAEQPRGSIAAQVVGEPGAMLVEQSAVVGYQPRANTAAKVAKDIGGRMIYNVTYRFDAYARRVTPTTETDAGRFLLFFGGSRTFGEGVNDTETIPYYVGRHTPGHRPYTYAYGGWGPAQFLAILQARPIEKEIAEPEGIVIFHMIEGHIRRTVGTYYVATNYNGGFLPHFERVADGTIRRDNMFVNGRPVRQFFYSLLSQSRTFNYFVNDLPLSDRDYSLTADVLLEIKKHLAARLKVRRFIVFFHPWQASLTQMEPLLRERDIEYHNLIDLFDADDEAFVHSPLDTHLSPLGNRTVAQAMVDYLHETGEE